MSAASEHSSHNDKVHEELLEVVTHAMARLQLDWPQEQETPKRSKLEDRFLSGGQVEGPERRSLPCFEDLHDELTCSWGKPYSFHVFVLSMSTYSTIVGARAYDYMIMPKVEETLVGYLSPGSSSSLKTAALPTKLCRTQHPGWWGKRFNQAGAALHTMEVLQADLLKVFRIWGGLR